MDMKTTATDYPQTNATTQLHLWRDTVETAVVRRVGVEIAGVGATGDWLRAETQHARILRWHGDGVPAWIAIDTLCGFAAGAKQAAREDRDSDFIRATIRRGRIEGRQ